MKKLSAFSTQLSALKQAVPPPHWLLVFSNVVLSKLACILSKSIIARPDPSDSPSVPEEIQNIPQGTCLGLVDLRVFAACARHGGEFLALNIHELCEKAASCRELIRFKHPVPALWTFPLVVLHFDILSRTDVH